MSSQKPFKQIKCFSDLEKSADEFFENQKWKFEL